MADLIYAICKGDKDNEAVILLQSYECLEDAIQKAREKNAIALNNEEISFEDVFGLWEQRTGEDLSELLTIGLMDKGIAKIAEVAKVKYGNQMTKQEAIDTVIQNCYEGGFLPYGWYGVLQMVFHKAEEEE